MEQNPDGNAPISRDLIEQIGERMQLAAATDDYNELHQIVLDVNLLVDPIDRAALGPSDDPFQFMHTLRNWQNADG
jgi:hypothetical protein